MTVLDVTPRPDTKPLFAAPAFLKPWLVWPDGTTFFAVRTWLSLGLALYLAFLLELDSASSAGITSSDALSGNQDSAPSTPRVAWSISST